MKNCRKINFLVFPQKQKILLVDKITIFNLIFLIFLKIVFNKVFFLQIDKKLRSKRFLLIFKKFGIEWLNYNQYNIQECFTKKLTKATLFCDKYSIYISKKIWNKNLDVFFYNKDLLSNCLHSAIKPNIEDIYEMMEAASILRKTNRVNLFANNSFFFKQINKEYFFQNLSLINFNLDKIFNFFYLFVKNINFFKKKNLKKKKNYLNYIEKQKNFSVAFFPHKGIFFERESKIKDYFYLKKPKSNFNKKNIAHIEWSSSDLNKNSYNYYSKNKIPLFFWDLLSRKKKSALIVFKFFLPKFILIFNLLKFSILFEFLTSAILIHNAKEIITNNFTKLKYVLAGRDILFPREIAIACKHLDIKTITVQTRLLEPTWCSAINYDYYFSSSPKSEKIFKKRMGKNIKHIIRTSPFAHTETTNSFYLKKNNNYNNRLKCLVIDYHSWEEKHWYDNGMARINWAVNLEFYYKILFLAQQHTNILFLIKSKNYVWLKNSYFKDLIRLFNKQKNIKILNLKKWTPDSSVKFADFAIAQNSSLSDKMLYQNKPIIIFNLYGWPGETLMYDKKLLIRNLDQVNKKILLIKKNYMKYNKSLDGVRQKLFYYKSKPEEIIKKTLTFFDDKLTSL